MFARFLPKETNFFTLFNAHAEQIVRGANELSAMVASLVKDTAAVEKHAKAIDEIEYEADLIAHKTLSLVHTSFNTPLDRDEIHQLISRMDDILDLIQDASESFHLYEIPSFPPAAGQLAELVQACCERVKSAVLLLSDLNNATVILKICHEIDQLESDADRVMRYGIAQLYRDEPDLRQMIKYKEIYELLELVTDRCEDVANILQGIVLENS